MGAGLLSSLLFGAVRSCSWTESSRDHEDATERLNELLRRKTSLERFASLFWGYYEPESSTCRYINAGHLPMLVIRNTKHEGISVKRLSDGGPVLGIVEWGNYRQGSVRVEEGDLLILFSDGVLEAMNAAHDPFGEHRLLDAIRKCVTDSPVEIQRAVQSALSAHVGGGEHEKTDDRTLIIARFRNVRAERVSKAVDEIAI
jgi:sigma-B regulation protein RsbU (phosphoserine phosphatase)